jgi:hypothetical protein
VVVDKMWVFFYPWEAKTEEDREAKTEEDRP